MKKRTLFKDIQCLFFVFVISISVAHAQDYTDFTLTLTAITLLQIDKKQTFKISKDERESNIFLGKSPSVNRIENYFNLAIVGVIFLHFITPKKIRRHMLGSFIVVQSSFVLGNQSLGYKIDF